MPDTHSRMLSAAMDPARSDVIRVYGILFVVLVFILLALKKKVSWKLLVGVVIAAFLIDILPVDRQLIGKRNFTPKSYTKQLFQEEYVIRKLKKDDDLFRIHLLDSRYRAANWWSYFNVQSTGGYFGAKMAQWQKLMERSGLEGWGAIYSHPKLLDALNVRYIISSYPLETIFGELEKRSGGKPQLPASAYILEVMPRDPRGGSGAFIYRNPGELDRVRLVGDYRMVDDLDQMIETMLSGSWNPKTVTLLEKKPNMDPIADGDGTAEIVSYEPEKIVIKAGSKTPKLLILADSYYPSGWKATVDGEETEILRADGILRAVAIPAGDHEVVFSFKPKMFYAGLWISLITAIGMIGWFVFWVIGRIRGNSSRRAS